MHYEHHDYSTFSYFLSKFVPYLLSNRHIFVPRLMHKANIRPRDDALSLQMSCIGGTGGETAY